MNVNFDGRTYSFEVKPGPDGYRQFTEAIRWGLGLGLGGAGVGERVGAGAVKAPHGWLAGAAGCAPAAAAALRGGEAGEWQGRRGLTGMPGAAFCSEPAL